MPLARRKQERGSWGTPGGGVWCDLCESSAVDGEAQPPPAVDWLVAAMASSARGVRLLQAMPSRPQRQHCSIRLQRTPFSGMLCYARGACMCKCRGGTTCNPPACKQGTSFGECA